MTYDRPNVYLSWGDHTTAVDHMRHQRWVDDAHSDRHHHTRRRGDAYERAEVAHMARLLSSTPTTLERTPFLPTVAATMHDRWQVPCGMSVAQCVNGKRVSHEHTADGQLPTVRKHLDANNFADATKSDIERAMYEQRHNIAARVHDVS